MKNEFRCIPERICFLTILDLGAIYKSPVNRDSTKREMILRN